jgi:hypothetical protein
MEQKRKENIANRGTRVSNKTHTFLRDKKGLSYLLFLPPPVTLSLNLGTPAPTRALTEQVLLLTLSSIKKSVV